MIKIEKGKTTKNLFDELYDKTDEAVKKLQKPLIKRQIKRRFTSAYDDAENKKINAESRLQELRSDFKGFDLNDVLVEKQAIENAVYAQKLISAEYKELFGTTIPKSD